MFRSITNNTAKNLSAGGTISGDVTIAGDLTVNGNGSGNYDEIVNGNLAVGATDKIYLDGGGNTYIQESSADNLSLVAGANTALVLDANSRISLGNNDSGGDTSNTIFGRLAGNAIASTGIRNVLIGDESGSLLTTGEQNIAIGRYALKLATTQADDNVAIGNSSMAGNFGTNAVTGCIMIGSSTGNGVLTSTASGSIGIGLSALNSLTSGANNLAIGKQALDACNTGASNIAVGNGALGALTDAVANVAMGLGALGTNVSGNFNTAFGHQALQTFNADVDGNNVAVGINALQASDTGTNNTVVGAFAGDAVTSGDSNVAIGKSCMTSLTSGDANIAIGMDALGTAITAEDIVAIGKGAAFAVDNDTADGTIAIGKSALVALTSGAGSVALGFEALKTNTTGSYNVGIGYQALHDATTEIGNVSIGYKSGEFIRNDASDYNVFIGTESGVGGTGARNHNIAMGYRAMGSAGSQNNIGGNENIFIGSYSGNGTWVTAGSDGNTAVGYDTLSGALNEATLNTAVGKNTLKALITADNNTAVGADALKAVTTGHSNVAIGAGAGDALVNGVSNVIIGKDAEANDTDGGNCIAIGAGAVGQDNNSVTLGNADVTDVYMGSDSGATVRCAGISFPSSQVASGGANVLDDYEEGVWTPVVKDSQGTPNAAGMVSGATGFYTKIGNMVQVSFAFQINSVSGMTGTDTVTIHGLPFTIKTGHHGGGEPDAGLITFINNLDSTDFGSGIFARANNNTTHLELKYTAGGAVTGIGGSSFLVSQFDADADTYMAGSCTYRVN